MPTAALQVWLRAQALLWLPGIVACGWLGAAGRPGGWTEAWILAMASSVATLAWILRAPRRAADLVTRGRFAGLLWVVGSGAAGVDTVVWLGAVAVVSLDLVDGAVARRWGGSPEGAILDMETDQLTVLGLSSLIVGGGGGVHVLALPALRYVFVLAMWCVGAPAHDPKPVNGDNRRGRLVCALVMVALLAALWPASGPGLRDAVTAFAVLLLGWSFSGDARFLIAHRRAAGVRG